MNKLMRFIAFASEGFEKIDNYCSFRDCCCRTCIKTVLFTDETPVDHHQVPRLCIKSIRGTIKVETGTANRRRVEPGKETSLEPLKHSLFVEK